MEQYLDRIAALPEPLGALVLLAAALIEYVFPPFPGDAICLFGAFLVGHAGWSLPLVFSAVLIGNVIGLSVDYWIGTRLRRRMDARAAGAPGAPRLAAILALEPRFREHATMTLAINRFLPGIRALLFVAAGFFGVRFTRAVALGAASAAAWNAAIFTAGAAIGANWEQLSTFVSRYTTVVWILLGAVAVVLPARWLLRRRLSNAPPRK